MSHSFVRRGQLVSLFALMALVALIVQQERRPGPVPKPEPTPRSTTVSVSDRADRDESVTLNARLKPVVFVQDWAHGCHGGATNQRSWVAGAELCYSEGLSLPLSEIEQLRSKVHASRHSEDVLDEFGLAPEVVRRRMAELFPKIEGEPPALSLEELRATAAAILFESELGGSTQERGALLIVGGEPAMVVRVNTWSLFAGSSFGGHMYGLPMMQVSVGGQQWETLSPELARAVLPFAPDDSYWELYARWGDQFLEHEARVRGEAWAGYPAFPEEQIWYVQSEE